MRPMLLVILMLASTAEALDVSLDPYRQARQAAAVGMVAGRVYVEPSTLRAPARPMTGTTVTLLPRSEGLWARLGRLKEQSRESSTAFTAAAPAMRKAQQAYERELLEVGAPDLTPLVMVDRDGGFKIEELPAGSWMLVAWHSSPTDVSAPKTKAKERGLYLPRTRLQGYQAVTVWLRDVTVAGGTTATVDLTDRNAWFRGVIEERVLDADR
jgi:hypothetical protein